jgi:hypothetical protein
MANKRQIKTIAKNLVAQHLLLGGDFDTGKLLTEKELSFFRKEIDQIAYSIVRRVYKVPNDKSDSEGIIKDVLENVK